MLVSQWANLVVITGTRDGREDVEATLELYLSVFGPAYFVLGGDRNGRKRSQRGVDLQALRYLKARGLRGRVFYAQWDDGPSAGPFRNGRMVRYAGPRARLLAFPAKHSPGTWDCFRQGQAHGLHCVEVRPGWVETLQALAA